MEGKELENTLVQTEDKAIVSTRTEIRMVTLLRVEMMEVLSEGNSKTIISMDMHILSLPTMMNMMANGREISDMEKVSSRRHRLEELKEGYMNGIISKRSFK